MRRLARFGLYGGVVGIVLGLSKIHARWVADTPYSWHTSSRFAWSMCYIAALIVACYGMGLPDLARSRRSSLVAAVVAPLLGAGAISLVQLATGDALLPRFVVFGTALLLVPWAYFCAALARRGRQAGEQRDRVLLVGSDDVAVTLADDLTFDVVERPATLGGHLTLAGARPLATSSTPVADALQAADASVLVLDQHAQADDQIVAQAAPLHASGVRVRTLADFYEEWLGKLPVSELERTSLLFDVGEVHRERYARLKRLFDIPIALVGFIALAVVTPIVVIGNLLANRGSLFYRQERVGMDGRVFLILKFRTMRPADSTSTQWTTDRDPRITPFGSLLRRSHLDELPQVINILRGELSVVGPRPEQPRYVTELSQKLPFYEFRLMVHPGLTGWAQVMYGYAGDEEDALEKLQYDFFYLRHQSLGLDIRTVARTVRSVIGRGGR